MPVCRCIVRSCIMPRYFEKLCFHHFHFFDWPISLTGRSIDLENLYNHDDPDPARTYFSILPYWERNVDKFEKTLKIERAGGFTVSVEGSVVYQSEPLDAVRNYQHGRDVSRKGWGHKKIRKKQRMRPAGWHGKHPDNKPIKPWTRQRLEDLPMITPAL